MDSATINETWKKNLSEAESTLTRFAKEPEVWKNLEQFSSALIETFSRGGTVFACGNGGSHCDAMHFAEELTGKYRKDRRPLGALALGDPSHLSCVANDYGFEHVFERQILGLGRKGDALILLSTSGNSKNLILAAQAARSREIKTIGLLGREGGKLRELCDLAIVVPAQTSDRIQEIHIKLIHTVIETIERALFPELYA